MAVANDGENWDHEEVRDEQWRMREIPWYQAQGATVREVAGAPPQASRSMRRCARRYNPNRHLERNDYVSAKRSPSPHGSEAGPLCQRARPDEPHWAANAHVPGGARVRLEGIIFGGLRQVPTDPSIDPTTASTIGSPITSRCPRPRVRIYCRNCGRHGEDLRSCPRCGEAHAEYLRRNFGGESRYEENWSTEAESRWSSSNSELRRCDVACSSLSRSGARVWRLACEPSRFLHRTAWPPFLQDRRNLEWVHGQYQLLSYSRQRSWWKVCAQCRRRDVTSYSERCTNR